MQLSASDIQHLQSKQLGILCGGRSLEHEVSLTSAKWALEAALAAGVETTLFWLSKENRWFRVLDQQAYLQNPQQVAHLNLQSVTPVLADTNKQWQALDNTTAGQLDIVFPVMHGLDGEDGPMQGLFQYWDVAFIGPNIRDAVITMNKRITKNLLQATDIPLVPWIDLTKGIDTLPIQLPETFTFPLFVKASNGGSSIGVYKVYNEDEMHTAIEKVWLLDRDCLIEKGIQGQEIEVAALISDEVQVTNPGEVEILTDFYDYRSKYLDKNASIPHDTAKLNDTLREDIKTTAKKVCQVLGCEGMARVDFFVDKDGHYYVNEVNPIPGLTPISLFPVLWAKEGLAAKDLLLTMMAHALKRFAEKNDTLKQMQLIAQEAITYEP